MEELVRETTGISLEGLREPLSPNISVAAKMSWASQRETTREEDMAYCLMGLFNVNMPSLYGEGCYNAFLRLQLEIIKQSNDRSIFAWRALSNNLKDRGLLANSPQEFIDSGTVRFTGGAQLEFPKEQNHDPQDNTRCLMALLLCLLGGCCCSYIVLFSDSQEQSRRSKTYKVDPTYNMNNANLHIHFPFHQLGIGSEKISVYLGCFIDDSPIWIRVVNVGNNQFQRIEMDRFVQPQTHRGPHRPEEMYFQQPVLDRCTSRIWMNFAQRTMFILPQSIKSIGTYSFMRHAEWHPEHSTGSGRFFHNTFQAPYPSWCLPFHDPIHQRGFVISIRVDSRHRMFCGVSSVASVPAEVDMLAVSKYYWERCMLGSARDRENHGDRAFFVIEEGIVSVLVRNITENFAWEDAINTAIFAVDISLINDSALRPVLCVPPALDPNSLTDLVLQMDLNQDCQLTLHRKKAKQTDLGNNVKILSVPRDNLPILMTFHGSFGQVGVILGLSYENIWVDIITDPEFGDGENFPNHKKINDTYVRSEIPKTKGQDCVSGEWVLSNASGRFTRQHILVRTGKITSPYQFGSFTVSVHIDTVHVGKYSTA
ncbi:hypothetical protein VKT23_017505 [Stygiomarasmius scandens]|uniref:Uncharacterized protein n=1 Tax=Marasmiellus scandens TaxID=2682957 RepID=A0ABR1IS86_9AGAR